MGYNLLINGIFLGVKSPTDPFTFDPNFLSGTSKVRWVLQTDVVSNNTVVPARDVWDEMYGCMGVEAKIGGNTHQNGWV